MKKSFLVASTLLSSMTISSITLADQYSGHITSVSIDDKSKNLVFEVANQLSDSCESSWFSVPNSGRDEVSPAQFVVQSYFHNKNVTIQAGSICAGIGAPSRADAVTLGMSTQDIEALKASLKKKAKKEK